MFDIMTSLGRLLSAPVRNAYISGGKLDYHDATYDAMYFSFKRLVSE